MTPSGIVMASSSVGATQEAIEKVLTENGHEPEKPAAAAVETPVEPKREDFKTDEEFARRKRPLPPRRKRPRKQPKPHVSPPCPRNHDARKRSKRPPRT